MTMVKSIDDDASVDLALPLLDPEDNCSPKEEYEANDEVERTAKSVAIVWVVVAVIVLVLMSISHLWNDMVENSKDIFSDVQIQFESLFDAFLDVVESEGTGAVGDGDDYNVVDLPIISHDSFERAPFGSSGEQEQHDSWDDFDNRFDWEKREYSTQQLLERNLSDDSTEEQMEVGAMLLDSSTWNDFHIAKPNSFVVFYAPWCVWSQRLLPVWDELADEVRRLNLPVSIGKVDCKLGYDVELCRSEHVLAFPTMRWYTEGKSTGADYHMDRTVDALQSYIRRQLLDKKSRVASLSNDVRRIDSDIIHKIGNLELASDEESPTDVMDDADNGINSRAASSEDAGPVGEESEGQSSWDFLYSVSSFDDSPERNVESNDSLLVLSPVLIIDETSWEKVSDDEGFHTDSLVNLSSRNIPIMELQATEFKKMKH